MIPQSNFNPWLPVSPNIRVRIISEPKAPENPKIHALLIFDVEYKGQKFAMTLSQTAYNKIAKHQAFGLDTADWVGKEIQYVGKEKTSKGGAAHIWNPVEPVIDVEAPF